ncbi:MAG: hypothetical protein JW838_14185 [Spirochaetes bacterium]|nr:hypothetical protein [Spirochaetota bacterium]
MDQTFAYCYFMKFVPERLRSLIPEHIAYWQNHAPDNFTGGPFRDRSGGLIIFPAADQDTAESICRGDPFVTGGLVEEFWVREWLVSHRR